MDELRNLAWKFQEAIETMATSTGSLQDRLWQAWVSHLASLDDRGFPDDLRDEWLMLRDVVTAKEAIGTGSKYQATCQAMSDEEAHDVAELTVRLAGKLRRASQEQSAQ